MVVDEFSELLTAKPDFIEMFVQIGRIGRSLGVCTCCSPRSGWRRAGCAAWTRTSPTGSVCGPSPRAESRTALGVPDAYHLPPMPGPGS